MKNQSILAILISIVVIIVSSLIILGLEPSNKTEPYFHDKTINEIESFFADIKKDAASEENLFDNLIDLDNDTLKYIVGIEPEYLESSLAKTSTTNASTILVLKPKNGAYPLVESSVLDYMDYLEKSWKGKDENQANLVQNYSKISMGDYLIYVISENNEYVKDLINAFFIYTDK